MQQMHHLVASAAALALDSCLPRLQLLSMCCCTFQAQRGAAVLTLRKGLQDTHITWTMQQDAAFTLHVVTTQMPGVVPNLKRQLAVQGQCSAARAIRSGAMGLVASIWQEDGPHQQEASKFAGHLITSKSRSKLQSQHLLS
jgi:hypothetical protein